VACVCVCVFVCLHVSWSIVCGKLVLMASNIVCMLYVFMWCVDIIDDGIDTRFVIGSDPGGPAPTSGGLTVVALLLLLLHCCYTLLLHCCYTVVAIDYSGVTLLLHCCYTAVTLFVLLHCCYIFVF
jgi:hypothetical protein